MIRQQLSDFCCFYVFGISSSVSLKRFHSSIENKSIKFEALFFSRGKSFCLHHRKTSLRNQFRSFFFKRLQNGLTHYGVPKYSSSSSKHLTKWTHLWWWAQQERNRTKYQKKNHKRCPLKRNEIKGFRSNWFLIIIKDFCLNYANDWKWCWAQKSAKLN